MARTLLLVLLLLPSCTLVDNLNRAIAKGVEISDTVGEIRREWVASKAELKAEIAATKDAIDSNADGKITSEEFKTWLMGGGFLTLLTAGGFLARNAKSNERKTRTEGKLEQLAKNLDELRAAPR